ncbi:hypothetical protein ACH5RR_037326 [Cinchona calisaya]|uniref:Retrotransposon Copia-like N-terminal domain-containing protein n=1 Tax=Cinchona calisaya TaxID=153742 RepID=A0ABD2YAJ1_9GENT
MPSSSSLSHPSYISPIPTMLTAPNITHLVPSKLDSTNYLLWKSQFVSVLIRHDLLGYVDGSLPCPPKFLLNNLGNPLSNPQFVAWIRTDQCLHSWITATLTKDISQEIHDLPSSHDVWVSLERRFIDQSVAHKLQLNQQLQTLKKGIQSMKIFRRKLNELADSLATIGSSASSKDLIIYALPALPSEYESFVTTITHANTIKSFEDLKSKLLHQEQRILLLHQHDPKPSTTLVAATNTGFGQRGLGCGLP